MSALQTIWSFFTYSVAFNHWHGFCRDLGRYCPHKSKARLCIREEIEQRNREMNCTSWHQRERERNKEWQKEEGKRRESVPLVPIRVNSVKESAKENGCRWEGEGEGDRLCPQKRRRKGLCHLTLQSSSSVLLSSKRISRHQKLGIPSTIHWNGSRRALGGEGGSKAGEPHFYCIFNTNVFPRPDFGGKNCDFVRYSFIFCRFGAKMALKAKIAAFGRVN